MPIVLALTPGIPDFSRREELNGAVFALRFLWASRSSSWRLSISTADGALLAADLALVPNFPIGARLADPRAPRGVFVVLDSRGNDAPGLNDLGARHSVVFWERA